MFDSKSFLASKTIWGAVVMLLPTIAGYLGLTVTEADAGQAVDAVQTIVEAVGALLVVWGRATASKSLKLL